MNAQEALVKPEAFGMVAIDKLVKADWNYKIDNDEMSEKLAANLMRNGQVENILVRELETGFFEVVNGNHRYDALKKLGVKTVYCHNLGKISTDAAVRIAIETNETRFDGDEDKLSRLFQELIPSFSFEELEKTMPYDRDELEAFMQGLADDVEIVDDDYVPTVEVNPCIETGDLIVLGDHRLVCGDSRDAKLLERLLDGQVLDMLITDPPYGVSYKGGTKLRDEIENDDLNENDLAELWHDVLENWLGATADGGAVYASVPSGTLMLVFMQELKDRGIYRQGLVWNKERMAFGRSDYHYSHESILYGWKPGSAHYFTDDRTKTTVLTYPKPQASPEHPTMKPIALWAELIGNSSKPGQAIGDPFSGSGTTILASQQLGRRAFGMELAPSYCRVIIDRYIALCGVLGLCKKVMVNGLDWDRVVEDRGGILTKDEAGV